MFDGGVAEDPFVGERDKGAIQVQLRRLEKQVAEAHAAAERLVSALAPVARQTGLNLQREGGHAVPTPVRSEMADAIARQADRVSELSLVLSSAFDALDL